MYNCRALAIQDVQSDVYYLYMVSSITHRMNSSVCASSNPEALQFCRILALTELLCEQRHESSFLTINESVVMVVAKPVFREESAE